MDDFNTTLLLLSKKIKLGKPKKFKYDSGNHHYLETETRMARQFSDGTPISLGLEIIQPIDLNDKVKFI